jgi:Flp pilus assembly protein TadG
MKYRTSHSGQSLVEFALTATLLISLLLGIVDFGRAYYTQVQIKNAVAEGGYYAIQNPGNDSGIRSQITQELSGLDPAVQDSDITITRSCTISGAEQTSIGVEYQHTLLFGFIIPHATTITLGSNTVVPQLGGC